MKKIDIIREKVTGSPVVRKVRDVKERKIVATTSPKVIREEIYNNLDRLKNKMIKFWDMEFQFHDYKIIGNWVEFNCDYKNDSLPIRIPITCINQLLSRVKPNGVFIFTHNSKK